MAQTRSIWIVIYRAHNTISHEPDYYLVVENMVLPIKSIRVPGVKRFARKVLTKEEQKERRWLNASMSEPGESMSIPISQNASEVEVRKVAFGPYLERAKKLLFGQSDAHSIQEALKRIPTIQEAFKLLGIKYRERFNAYKMVARGVAKDPEIQKKILRSFLEDDRKVFKPR